MDITLIGQAGIAGAFHTSPQVITYSSATTDTLIITGHFANFAGAPDFPVSITDTASNTWRVSTSNAQNPPTQQISEAGQFGTDFVAWCVNAAGVTSVTVARQDSDGANSWWRIALSEWSGITQFSNSWAGTGASSTSFTSGPVTLDNGSELVVGAADSFSGAQTIPSGWTGFTSMGDADNGYYLPGTTGSYSPVWATTVADVWTGALAVFSGPQAATPRVVSQAAKRAAFY